MEYNKPEIIASAIAMNAIAGDEKPPEMNVDSSFPNPLNATIGAYQSDE
jgi:hypothetical protein